MDFLCEPCRSTYIHKVFSLKNHQRIASPSFKRVSEQVREKKSAVIFSLWKQSLVLLHKLKCLAIVSECVGVCLCVSKFHCCCRCCSQIQLVYGLNYAKNVLNHLSFSSLPSSSTSVLCAVLFGVVSSNQYFAVHACVQISMLKNLWALLHICTIYSYSRAQKERTSHTLQLSPS